MVKGVFGSEGLDVLDSRTSDVGGCAWGKPNPGGTAGVPDRLEVSDDSPGREFLIGRRIGSVGCLS